MIVLEDKEGLKIINTTFGALLVQTLRALDSSQDLTSSTIPDLEIGLERFTRWGVFAEKRLQIDSPYLTVVRGYGAKLFGDRTQEERKMMHRSRLDAYKQFLKKMPKYKKENRMLPNGSYVMDEVEDLEEDVDKDPWKGAESTGVEFTHTDFDAELAFKKYIE